MNYQPIDEDLPTGILPYSSSKSDRDKPVGEYQAYVPGFGSSCTTEEVEKGASTSKPWWKEALHSIPNQDFSLYTAPLQLHSDLTLQDRLVQIWGCARPWSEFFDVRSFALPGQGEENGITRVKSNLETFFYNYVISCFCFLFLFLFVHPIQVFSLMLCILVAAYLFLWKQEPIAIFHSFHLDVNGKLVVLGVTVLLGFVLGHMATVLFNFVLYFSVVVLLHAFLRENNIRG